MRFFAVIALAMTAASCATFVNPYNEDFSCPRTFNGKCVSITEAYDESVEGAELEKEKPEPEPCDCWPSEIDCECEEAEQKKDIENAISKQEKAASPNSPEDSYRESLYGKLSRLIDEPVTPMVAPPKVLRVLLLPYEGPDNALYMYRYVYFFVDEPRWILDELATPTEDYE
ncbi:MAG: TraV family lipoprotein [Candidatus Nitrospinota bacterium M3_3B_026]